MRVDFGTLPQGSTQTYDLNGALDHEATRTVVVAEQAEDADFGYRAAASVGDLVWNDADADGVVDAGESGISGVRVYLDINGNGVFDGATEPSDITDGSGIYQIDSLLPGTYAAKIDTSTLPAGFVQTSDLTGALDHAATISLSASQARTDVDFGYTQRVVIGDFVWNDQDADGVQDPGEPGIDGVTVTAFFAATDSIAATTVTAAGGAYSFDLMPGTYYLVFDTPAGYQPTLADQGGDAADSDANAVTGRTPNVSLTGGQSDLDIDAGFYQPGTIFGRLYLDTNGNGVQDGIEPGIADVDVIVTDVNGATYVVSTDSNGDWSALVPPGPATADVDESDPQYPSGHAQTEGDDPTAVLAVSATDVDAGNDGYFLPGAISGAVFADTDGDGDGDVPLENVVLRLLDSLGNPVLDGSGDPITTLTLADGSYSFGGLPPGDYCVVQDQPSGYASVSDTDGPNDNVIGNVTPIAVTAGSTNVGNDFIEIQLGSISGSVLADDDNNGSGDSPIAGVLLGLLDGSGNPVLDSLGAPVQVATNASGFYQFSLVLPGSYRVSQVQPSGYASVSDVDGANNNLIGDETPIVITPGLHVTGRDFVEVELGAISGSVLADVDDDGDGEAPLAGVTLTLLDAAGDPLATTTTDALGGYRFDDLLPGIYQVAETQPSGYASVSDVDGGNPDLIGNVTALAVAPGQEVGGRDFIEIELGSISGYVFAGSAPLGGVTLTLLDEFGNPVDGDPSTPGVQPVTTVTDGSGFYRFDGVIPGIYQIAQTQPFGYDSFGDIDGGDLDIVGDVTPVVVTPGAHSENNNFIETLDTCPDDWTHWKFLHPAETPGGNPDQDAYDNFAEFAFAMPHDGGAGSPWLGNTAWVIRPSSAAPGTLEGVFIRHKGAPDNVVYTLQYAAAPGSPTVWQEIVLGPSLISTSDNGDCTETVTIPDLEALTGLTGGAGIVRIKAELDDDGGNDEVDHTSFSETEGWQETDMALCCRTYNNPFLRESVFTGTIGSVSGQDLVFPVSAASVDLAALLGSGAYFLEVTSGENEGHRFDIASAAGNTITVANDTQLDSTAAPFNTVTGAPPATLAGDTIAIRPHWTLGELFPADSLGAAPLLSGADQVQLFAGGLWAIFWLYDDAGTPRWVDIGDATMADRASTIIAPGQGMFFQNRATPISLLAYGEVRENDFLRPLPTGNSLVGGGYPVDQSPVARAMTVAGGFQGSPDFKAADSFFIWRTDANAAATGYDTIFLLHGIASMPSVQRWARVGDSPLSPRDNQALLLGNRAVFVRSRDGLPAYTIPAPWTP